MIDKPTPPAEAALLPEPAGAKALDASLSELLPEPDYPPPESVPVPSAPAPLRTYGAPIVEDVSPAVGPVLGGTKLVLTGQNLYRASIVRVGGLIAQTVGADEPRELRVLTPPAERPGLVSIVVENPFVPPANLPNAFRYEALLPPSIASVAPHHVGTKGGAEITISGAGFVAGSIVLVDGERATSLRVVSDKAIDLKVPPGQDQKLVDVVVKNPDGQTAAMPRAFMYDKRYG